MKPKYSDDDASMLYIVQSEVQTQENCCALAQVMEEIAIWQWWKGRKRRAYRQSSQNFERGRNQPANREFYLNLFGVNLIDCKVRGFPVSWFHIENTCSSLTTVFITNYSQRTAVRHIGAETRDRTSRPCTSSQRGIILVLGKSTNFLFYTYWV